MNTQDTIDGASDIGSSNSDTVARPAQKSRLVPLLGWTIGLAGVSLFAAAVYADVRSRERSRESLNAATELAAIPTVNVISPQAGAAAEELELPGNTQAFIDTAIYARASGYLKRWNADIGTPVHAGDLLAEIEVPELDQQLRQAEAEFRTAAANLELAKITDQRWKGLAAEKVVSRQEADQVQSDLSVKQAQLVASQANVERLKQIQTYERIVAPFDGVITARATDIGALIDATTGANGKELFHLAAIDQLRVYVSVPEVYAKSVQNGAKVTIKQSANSAQTIAGTVTRNASAIDPATHTLNVEVDVDNRSRVLLPGAYVLVRLKLAGESNSVTIPANALLFRTEGLRAAKVINGHVKLTPISIGHDFGATVEVTSGLTPQDKIVVDPSDSLMDGAEVEVSVPEKDKA